MTASILAEAYQRVMYIIVWLWHTDYILLAAMNEVSAVEISQHLCAMSTCRRLKTSSATSSASVNLRPGAAIIQSADLRE